MNTRNQLLCAWSGIAFTIAFMVGFWIVAGFVPPPTPTATATEIAAMYQNNTWQIRTGLLLMMAASGLMSPFLAVISIQMKRMEGSPHILTYTQLSSGTVGVLFLIIPCLIWTTAAFRPERDPEMILLLNDFGWILFLLPFTSFVVQNFAIGLAILGDKNAEPVFPRWVGFFTFWVAILFLPGGLLTFFKTGPFAWHGLFAFWIPLNIFFAWYIVMVVYLRRGIIAQAQELPARSQAQALPASR
ncbi:MAG: hypothetical protein ACREXT_04670 [Gammaproteobacteria bacterium]